MRCHGRSQAVRTTSRPTLAGRWAGWPGCGAMCWPRRSTDQRPTSIALGGGSLSAAQLVAAMRQRYPQVAVADLYDHPRLGSLAGYLDELDPPPKVETRIVKPTPRGAQIAQVALSLPLATLTGMQWVVWLALVNNVVAPASPGAVDGDRRLVVGRRRLRAVHQPAGPDGHRRARGAASVVRCGTRHVSARRVGPSSGMGRRTARGKPAARRIWRGRRGWCTTPARLATTSARESTCTPPRR